LALVQAVFRIRAVVVFLKTAVPKCLQGESLRQYRRDVQQTREAQAQLARANLAFDGQAYVVFDGNELRECRDAAAAIAMVVRAKRWCAVIAAIRTGVPTQCGLSKKSRLPINN
jgi:hypothetical protein